jgi:hypothetical protein
MLNWLSSLYQHYDHRSFLRGQQHVAEAITTAAQTFLVSFGVPLVLMLLLVVEHSRVMHGIQLFEQDYTLAWLAALSLVLVNLTLEFLVHYIEHRENYVRPHKSEWSLRLIGRSLSYKLGISKQWQPRPLSPADRYSRLLRLVTFTILSLALAGSMKSAIDKQPGQWHIALRLILTESNLSDMSTWTGGLLFALAAVAGAQNLTAYLAVRAAEIIEAMDTPQIVITPVHMPAEEDTAEVIPVLEEVVKTDNPLSTGYSKNGRHSPAN